MEPHPARAARRGSGGEPSADRNDEYAFYQLLLAAWPPELSDRFDDAIDAFRQRIEGAMMKSMREAKIFTTWASPTELRGRGPWLRPTRARWLALQSFPGEFLRVRGENRAPRCREQPCADRAEADGAGRAGHLSGRGTLGFQSGRSGQSPAGRLPNARGAPEGIRPSSARAELSVATWQDGRIKQGIVRDLLQLRARFPQLFSEGWTSRSNLPGPAPERLCGFYAAYG